jgi:glycosyltransferase involved in cell wall biosynthesis
MPVYNGVEFITRSIPPLIEMLRRGELTQVLVVDDGSTDDTVALSQQLGATVLHSGGRLGPGGARNQAAEQASGDILWFVDADVVVHESAARELAAAFSGEDIAAVFGSYDDKPPAENFFSQYKNLVHHYYHHRAKEEASTFWSGCGAVRKAAFLAVGGFDVERYKYPSIEDIELGHRLIGAGGRVRMCPSLLCTHLKVWRLGNLLHTEIFRRAIPWSRLILGGAGIPDDLNTGAAEQAKAVLAGLFLLATLLAALTLLSPYVALALAGAVYFANREIAGLFYRRRGLLFALGALLFHQVYYLYSATAFALVFIEQKILRLDRR